jgi:hypothetical protein
VTVTNIYKGRKRTVRRGVVDVDDFYRQPVYRVPPPGTWTIDTVRMLLHELAARQDMAGNDPSREDRRICEGDIVVTAVADHYAIGRMTADGTTQEPPQTEQTRTEALQRACALAGTAHRCEFLNPSRSEGQVPPHGRAEHHEIRLLDRELRD